jgi:hypothetical protein
LFDGRPKAVTLAHETLSVVSIERVRDELAAYPAAIGPRTCFDVETTGPRLRLAFRHRDRRWVLEGPGPLRRRSDHVA